jgi:hypothetical protein
VSEPTQPPERMIVGHFIVSDDVERSRRFYTEVLGGTVVFGPEPTNIALANNFIIINSGGGPTDDKPTPTEPRHLAESRGGQSEVPGTTVAVGQRIRGLGRSRVHGPDGQTIRQQFQRGFGTLRASRPDGGPKTGPCHDPRSTVDPDPSVVGGFSWGISVPFAGSGEGRVTRRAALGVR